MSLTDLPKDKTLTLAYQKRFKDVVDNYYRGWNHIYTHGFISEIGVGVAATTENRTESASLLKISSVFTAETQAIYIAPNTSSAIKEKNFSVFTN